MKGNRDSDLHGLLELIATNNGKVEMYNNYITYYIDSSLTQDTIIDFLNSLTDNTSFSFYFNPIERQVLFTARNEYAGNDVPPTFLPDVLALLSTLGDDTDGLIKRINSPIFANDNIILEHATEHHEYIISNPELAENFTDFITKNYSELLDTLESEN